MRSQSDGTGTDVDEVIEKLQPKYQCRSTPISVHSYLLIEGKAQARNAGSMILSRH
jgi:hypothetical protein